MWANRIIRLLLVCAAKTRLFVRPTVIGRENLSSSGGVVIASNHLSTFDPIGLFAPIVKFRPDVTFLAMAELFRSPIAGRILQWFGIIPVHRGTDTAVEASRVGVAVLTAGGAVAAFIEGKISRTGELLPPKNGVAYMASEAGVPVIPVAMVGTNRVKRPGTGWWHWGWRRRYTIVIGKPMTPPQCLSTKQQRDAFSEEVMEAIRSLIEMATPSST
ncbi:MAG TPA: lysophospholipid acyltransferase family protein [Candidatus Chromulinivoraceae bacterium]|nr:lysophospholipid acyltransferase family protein [Candidatus Chromulinivoraceae bacterium]